MTKMCACTPLLGVFKFPKPLHQALLLHAQVHAVDTRTRSHTQKQQLFRLTQFFFLLIDYVGVCYFINYAACGMHPCSSRRCSFICICDATGVSFRWKKNGEKKKEIPNAQQNKTNKNDMHNPLLLFFNYARFVRIMPPTMKEEAGIILYIYCNKRAANCEEKLQKMHFIQCDLN